MEGRLMASKGLSGAAPVLQGYGLSCEHDLSLLVQEDLNALSSQLTLFHSRILRTWVQGLAVADQHHKRDKKRAAGDVNYDPEISFDDIDNLKLFKLSEHPQILCSPSSL